MRVKASDIDIAAYQIRDGLDEATVTQYAERLEAARAETEAGAVWPFPPVELNLVGGAYKCIDGAHRVAAAIRAGWETVEATIVEVDDDEAKVGAACANLANGLPLTGRERKAAIVRVLTLRPAWSDAIVAKHMGVHRKTVARIRQEAGLGNRTERTAEAVAKVKAGKTNAEIAKAIGANAETIRKLPARYPNGVGKNGTNVPNLPPPPAPRRAPSVVTAPDFEGDRSCDGCTNCDPEDFKKARDEALLLQYRDELGQDIPAGRKAEYDRERDLVAEWLRQIADLKASIKHAAEDPELRAFAAPARKMDDVLADLDLLRSRLKDRKPEALCRCNGEGCRVCDGRGFLTVKQYNVLIPEEERFVAGTL